MLNKVMLIGNLGRDPEIRTTQTGSRIATLSLATTEKWKDKQSGERREKTEWHRVVVFNEGLVEVISQYVHKGSKLYLEGALQTRKWQDQSGQDRYTTEVVLSNFNSVLVMLGNKRDTQENEEPAAEGGQNTAVQDAPAQGSGSDIDDEIPF